MNKLMRVEAFPDLRKDVSNGGVVNSNIDSYDTYIHRKNKIIQEQAEKAAMKEEINTMKSDLSDIKDMLKLLLDKR
jgi:hypothetical protein